MQYRVGTYSAETLIDHDEPHRDVSGPWRDVPFLAHAVVAAARAVLVTRATFG